MHSKSLTTNRSSCRLVAMMFLLVALAALLPTTVLAQGEPKNELPFTRAVAGPGQGEAKNELPFTRNVGGAAVAGALDGTQRASASQGEPKNELPFTQSVVIPSGDSGSGFSWIDAGLGLVLGISVCVAGFGAAQLVRHKVPRTA